MQSFYTWWGVSAIALLILAGIVGRTGEFASIQKKHALFGILIDARERYSLNRLQLIMWTILILSTFLGLLISSLTSDIGKALAIPSELLGLLGISVTSATVSGAVKDSKNSTRAAYIAGGLQFVKSVNPQVQPTDLRVQAPRLAQVFLEEEGTLGNNKIISVSKFQNFVFTLALGVVCVVFAARTKGYPILDQQVLWLIGISHAGYIGGKLPNKD